MNLGKGLARPECYTVVATGRNKVSDGTGRRRPAHAQGAGGTATVVEGLCVV